jgi:hypothetical protein
MKALAIRLGCCLVVMGMTMGLGACASFKVQPPAASVNPAEVGDRYRTLYRIAHEDMSKAKLKDTDSIPDNVDTEKLLTAQQYAETGYTLALNRCDTFFDLVTKASNELQMTKSDFAALSTAAAAIIALVHRTSKPVGITAAAFGLGAVAFDNYQKYALLTVYPTQTHDLVRAAMNAYRTDSPPDGAKDIIEADARVSGYAQLCTYSNIVGLAGQAISKATVKAVGNTPSTVFTSAEDLANVKKIQSAPGLSGTPSDADLSVLAVMADSSTSDSDLPKLAKMLSGAVAKKVWDADKKQKLAALGIIGPTLNDLAKSNSAFATLISDTKAKLRPGDRPPTRVGSSSPGNTEWQPPTILVNEDANALHLLFSDPRIWRRIEPDGCLRERAAHPRDLSRRASPRGRYCHWTHSGHQFRWIRPHQAIGRLQTSIVSRLSKLLQYRLWTPCRAQAM